ELDQTCLQLLGAGRYRQPAVALPHDAAQRGIGKAPDQDRRMRSLQGARRGEDRLERVGLAAIADLAAGADPPEDLEVLVRDPPALPEIVGIENVELLLQP